MSLERERELYMSLERELWCRLPSRDLRRNAGERELWCRLSVQTYTAIILLVLPYPISVSWVAKQKHEAVRGNKHSPERRPDRRETYAAMPGCLARWPTDSRAVRVSVAGGLAGLCPQPPDKNNTLEQRP